MAHFDRAAEFIVKMTKCRPNVHGLCTRKGRSDTPTGHRSKLLLVSVSSSDLSAVSGGILNGPVFRRFTPDYD